MPSLPTSRRILRGAVRLVAVAMLGLAAAGHRTAGAQGPAFEAFELPAPGRLDEPPTGPPFWPDDLPSESVPAPEFPVDDWIGDGVPYRGQPLDDLWAPQPWHWQILPNNLIWTSYLAGPKEPRFATVWYDDVGLDPFNPGRPNGPMWDSTLGGRAAILRYGSDHELHPQGFELQIEGAAFVRLHMAEERDLRSSDYRFGIPLVYGVGRWQTKLAYYHLSAHLGDEAMTRYQTLDRVNYVRDVIVWGNSYYPLDWMRIYGEVGWSFFNDGGSQPWELQFGTELVQARPTGPRGAPFLAVNGMLRQELAWGGNVCIQTGWAWRGDRSARLFRVGFEYLNGSDPQYEFVYAVQNRAGVGLWYDF